MLDRVISKLQSVAAYLSDPFVLAGALIAAVAIQVLYPHTPVLAFQGLAGTPLATNTCASAGWVVNTACPVVGGVGLGSGLLDHMVIHKNEPHGHLYKMGLGMFGLGAVGAIVTGAGMAANGCFH